MCVCVCVCVCVCRAVYRNFARGGGGGEIGVWTKGGGGAPGGTSVISCEVLHSRGGENDTRGGECPSPLKYGPGVCVCVTTLQRFITVVRENDVFVTLQGFRER